MHLSSFSSIILPFNTALSAKHLQWSVFRKFECFFRNQNTKKSIFKYRQLKARQGKKNRANKLANSGADEINTMKVGDTFNNYLEEKKKGKKDKENATAKTKVNTVTEKEKDSNAKSTKDWTDEKVSLLIYMLELSPSLWNVYHTDYSKHDAREIAYSEIST